MNLITSFFSILLKEVLVAAELQWHVRYKYYRASGLFYSVRYMVPFWRDYSCRGCIKPSLTIMKTYLWPTYPLKQHIKSCVMGHKGEKYIIYGLLWCWNPHFNRLPIVNVTLCNWIIWSLISYCFIVIVIYLETIDVWLRGTQNSLVCKLHSPFIHFIICGAFCWFPFQGIFFS